MNFKNACVLAWAISGLAIAEGMGMMLQHTQASMSSPNNAHKRSADESTPRGLLDFLQAFKTLGEALASKGGIPLEGSGDMEGLKEMLDTLEGSGVQGLPDLEGLFGSGDGSGDGNGDEENPFQGLIDLAEALESLSVSLQGDDDGAKDEEPDGKIPCSSPYVEIAYRMCILPILDMRLSWTDAREYCSEKGLHLALDSVVIKSRRYLDEQLGEEGSRVRWPVWVGGKQEETGEKRWLWEDGTTIPNFLWSDGQPRSYDADSTPEGACMSLDGYTQYYGVSLPCHYRRRFVCQRP